MYFALQYATFEEISARADTITNVSFGKSTDALFNYGPLITSLVKVVNAPPPFPRALIVSVTSIPNVARDRIWTWQM